MHHGTFGYGIAHVVLQILYFPDAFPERTTLNFDHKDQEFMR